MERLQIILFYRNIMFPNEKKIYLCSHTHIAQRPCNLSPLWQVLVTSTFTKIVPTRLQSRRELSKMEHAYGKKSAFILQEMYSKGFLIDRIIFCKHGFLDV